MKALYSLAQKIAGFDFFCWLAMQQAYGATEIVFDARRPTEYKWPMATVLRRFESILWPGPALAGLPCSIGTEGEQLAPYHQADLVRLCRAGMAVHRLKSVLPPGTERYTVTLRRTERAAARNSNEADWRAFASEIGARLIPDYDDEPIHLHERMALYAGAEMNFFVTNGPCILCLLSDYPAMVFDMQKSPLTKLGVPFGEPYPFALPQHQMIYEPDELPVIRRHFYRWLEART